MSPIENAAREIWNSWRTIANELDISDIIRRHLFPPVKPEDVLWERYYWFKIGSQWKCGQAINSMARKTEFLREATEIRGPFQPPEDA